MKGDITVTQRAMFEMPTDLARLREFMEEVENLNLPDDAEVTTNQYSLTVEYTSSSKSEPQDAKVEKGSDWT